MRPLSDLTVLDLTVNTPGPFCSMILSDLGARVIKIEPPGGDPLRQSSPSMFAGMNRGKESLSLNLKRDGDRETLLRLAERADIVLEGSRPGVAKRLGADYETLSARNPGIVYCSISGFGQDGPWRSVPAHDVNYLAAGGYMGAQTAIEGRPWPPAILISDVASGMYAAISVLAGVVGRASSREGAYIDLSMTDAVLSLVGIEAQSAETTDAERSAPNVTVIPTYGLFACADGRWAQSRHRPRRPFLASAMRRCRRLRSSPVSRSNSESSGQGRSRPCWKRPSPSAPRPNGNGC